MLGITLMLHSTPASMPDGHVTHMANLMMSNGSCVRVCARVCVGINISHLLWACPGLRVLAALTWGTRSHRWIILHRATKPESEIQEGTFPTLASGTICGVFAIHHVHIMFIYS
ncbi:hypothetical protein AARAC_000950 [Aspergillus arachidicola]|uniref:Uncharacterized protein n=1 Tax=Aspergillus arachidicola TaxID=656916 RepID=A0A2G7G7B5_9EURO|nr:hypothetical protein AARAC_000950 [Aspergillus arachidicola]